MLHKFVFYKETPSAGFEIKEHFCPVEYDGIAVLFLTVNLVCSIKIPLVPF